jgi:hypothetical protein
MAAITAPPKSVVDLLVPLKDLENTAYTVNATTKNATNEISVVTTNTRIPPYF